MFFDPLAADTPLRRTVFNAIVTPRPIGWISTLDAQGRANLAPFSYFNMVSSNPPIVMFCCSAPRDRAQKDTLANALASGEFVYSLATVPLADAVNRSSTPVPHGEDEFALVGLDKAASQKVAPPRVAASPAAFECKVDRIVQFAPQAPGETTNTVVFGRVVGVHIAEGLLDANGRFDTLRAQPLCRLGGNVYAPLGAPFELEQMFGRSTGG